MLSSMHSECPIRPPPTEAVLPRPIPQLHEVTIGLLSSELEAPAAVPVAGAATRKINIENEDRVEPIDDLGEVP
jgi:hypothetical protein